MASPGTLLLALTLHRGESDWFPGGQRPHLHFSLWLVELYIWGSILWEDRFLVLLIFLLLSPVCYIAERSHSNFLYCSSLLAAADWWKDTSTKENLDDSVYVHSERIKLNSLYPSGIDISSEKYMLIILNFDLLFVSNLCGKHQCH